MRTMCVPPPPLSVDFYIFSFYLDTYDYYHAINPNFFISVCFSNIYLMSLEEVFILKSMK